jgi:hypothetical protein
LNLYRQTGDAIQSQRTLDGFHREIQSLLPKSLFSSGE